ncbi:MAG: glycosyltransferase [Bacteroidales bacterium]|nr:glycosyltransferase [Bacteroidales bacterium]
MKLSVIVVNYNVKYFLEQCLQSVFHALSGIEAEVFVVDNNSVDGSVQMVQERFPEVKLMANKENTGFSKANNQAIRQASGEYILLLNPDTIVEADTFTKSIEYMDSHPEAGGLGVKMVDGKGKFLPESKRGLPTPAVAFYKIFGLSRLFPGSRLFGKYHLGYLDKDEIHEVEILSGAFMFLRKKALDTTGLLDESFFMYGEDIDLSYRIIKAGYKNIYFPKTRIIHYKGESTKKSSVNYVVIFYHAMIIFARKHFSQRNAKLYSLLIHLAIYFRAFLAISNRFLTSVSLPFTDAVLLSGGIIGIKNYWEQKVIFPGGGHYPAELVSVAIPLYVFLWLFSVYMSGGYDKPVKISRVFTGLFIGSVIILTLYALLPERFRFSRALIVFGAIWGFVSMSGVRLILHLLRFRNFRLGYKMNKRFAIAGEPTEAGRVAELIRKAYMNPGFIGLVGVSEESAKHEGFIGNLSHLREIIRIYGIDEVIFCARDIPADRIIDLMSDLSSSQTEVKIAPPESLYIIGSKSISTSGDIYIVELDSIADANNRRSKRFLDIMASLCLFPLILFSFFIFKNPAGFVKNLFLVLFGLKSWVGYNKTLLPEPHNLPSVRKGVLYPTDAIKEKELGSKTMERLNLLYARDYKVTNDINIMIRGFRNMGRQ